MLLCWLLYPYFGVRVREIIQEWRAGLERASSLLLALMGIGVVLRS